MMRPLLGVQTLDGGEGMVVRRGLLWCGLLTLLVLVAMTGCKKKPVAAPPTPPPPPAPAAPTATLRATPSVIEQGQSTPLSWNSTNATELRLEPGPGSVGPQGSTSLAPERSSRRRSAPRRDGAAPAERRA